MSTTEPKTRDEDARSEALDAALNTRTCNSHEQVLDAARAYHAFLTGAENSKPAGEA